MIKEDLIAIYEQSFKENFNLPALSEYGSKKVMTYGQLASHIAYMHILFEQCGLKPGDKVALMGRNSVPWVTVFMATITYGAVIVPIQPDFTPQDATHIINHSDAELLFITESIWENLDFDTLSNLRGAINMDTRQLLAERLLDPQTDHPLSSIFKTLRRKYTHRYTTNFRPEHISYKIPDKKETCIINYTSGTTGFSKGVILSHNAIAANVVHCRNIGLHKKGSRNLAFLPLSHTFGCTCDMLAALACGGFMTTFGKLPAPVLLMKAFAEVRPTVICTVPLIIEKIYKKVVSPHMTKKSVRWALDIPHIDKVVYSKFNKKLQEVFGGKFHSVLYGGAPLNPEIEDFLHKAKFPICSVYGMTECGPLISISLAPKFKKHSVGEILPVLEYRLEKESDEHHYEEGLGELLVRGETVMDGYYKNPKATEAVLEKGGWLHTGDIGMVKDRVFYIRGRSKNMILTSNGQNIYPEEIEAKLNSTPFVAESLVVERAGQLVALVYPDYEASESAGISDEELNSVMTVTMKEINKMLPAYERLSKILLVASEFEKTPKKSIKRYLYNQ